MADGLSGELGGQCLRPGGQVGGGELNGGGEVVGGGVPPWQPLFSGLGVQVGFGFGFGFEDGLVDGFGFWVVWPLPGPIRFHGVPP